MKTKQRIRNLIVGVFIGGIGMFSTVFAQEISSDSLQHYIKIAIENNPGLKSQHHVHQAFLEKLDQAGAYSDPELSLEAYTMPMEVIGGRSIGNIGLMQMFPWFGTKKAARTEARHMANMQEQQYQELLDNLILQVSTQWYTLQKLYAQLHNTDENRALLKQLEQLALSRFGASSTTASPAPAMPATSATGGSTVNSTGMGGMAMGAPANQTAASISSQGSMSSMTGSYSPGMAEVLRIQLEMAELDNSAESLKSQIEAGKSTFNALLNRDAHHSLHISEEIAQLTFLYPEQEILSKIADNNPMLDMISEEASAFKAKAEMDRKMSYPMIGLGLEYMIIGKSGNSMFAMDGMNGKDMIMPMLTVSLPVFRKKYQAQQRESQFWRKASEENYKNTLNSLISEYYTYKGQLEDAARVFSLYEKQTTLAETTYSLVLKEFVSGRSDLANVIQVQRQLMDYQLGRAEALSNYNIMVVAIKKLISEHN